MKLTKYEHACFTIEQNGEVLVVDPGNWTTDFLPPENVIGIIITHEHPDHFDQEHIATIVDKNPDAVIISNQNVINSISAFKTTQAIVGQPLTIGQFTLEFYGGMHATIHPSIPTISNIGVLINDLLYYPGDSMAIPDKPVDTLALPVSAPWLKFSEAIDMLTTIRPRFAFPTHDAILSPVGRELVDRLANNFAEKTGTEYRRVHGQTITV